MLFHSFFLLYYVDKKTSALLPKYIDVEVERFTTNVVNRAISEVKINEKYRNFLVIEKKQDSIENISYDTIKIQELRNEIERRVQDVLSNLDHGEIDDYFVSDKIKYGKYKNIKKGVLCEISLGSIRGSSLFANVGPSIPIRLFFSGQIQSDIDVSTQEYGINNVIIKVYLIIKMREQIIMPLTSKRKDVIVKEPISFEIIQGKIPDYYTGFGK